jgi:hypothetical protein
MARPKAKSRSAATQDRPVARKVAAASKRNGSDLSSTVRFGSVVVRHAATSAAELQRNISVGQRAFARAATKLARAGVSLSPSTMIPRYHADPMILTV